MSYAPRADGEPDPGEVVSAWVAYEDDLALGKDRPVLLLGRRGERWLSLMLSSQDHDLDAADEERDGRHWMDVGSGAWDREGRPSEVRLDRLLELDPAEIRREGAALDHEVFTQVVVAARGLHDLAECPRRGSTARRLHSLWLGMVGHARKRQAGQSLGWGSWCRRVVPGCGGA